MASRRLRNLVIAGTTLASSVVAQQAHAASAPAVVQPAAAHPALWGIDTTDNLQTSGDITQTKSDLGVPQFVGRYLIYSTKLSTTEAAYIHGQGLLILLIDDPNHVFTSGAIDAQQAIAQAASLGVPHGAAIFRDVETNDPITSTYIAAYYAAFHGSGYTAGFYENAINGPFTGAYCAAVAANKAIANNSLLYSSEPEQTGANPRRSAKPVFGPNKPGCASRTAAWQYLERGLFPTGTWPNVDVDELAGRFSSFLWG
ncbi:MAG TPA: glycoside hydrolase domain-containing protein [Candidatus Dormibacteraeota bacterium]